jgi:hypothetical protein
MGSGGLRSGTISSQPRVIYHPPVLFATRTPSRRDLEEVAAAWRQWAADPDGWISVLHGELLIHL